MQIHSYLVVRQQEKYGTHALSVLLLYTLSVCGDTSDDEYAANSSIGVHSINAVDKTMIMLYIIMFCIILCAIVDVEYKYTLGSLDNVAGAPSQIRIPTGLESRT